MSLKLSLKPNERVIIGGVILRNGSSAAHIHVENKVPVLRQKDIMIEAEAVTPCKRIYLVVQLMYIGAGMTPELSELYWNLVRDVMAAAPSTKGLISSISQFIVNSEFYLALKKSKELILYEEELLRNVTKSD